ncbi:MAG: c-type cytochrome domain-containing protein [Candidatus Hydrogenedentota bacterium]
MCKRALCILFILGTGITASAQDAPTPDVLMNEMMQLGPEAIAAHVAKLKAQIATLEQRTKVLDDEAAALEAQEKATRALIAPYTNFTKAMMPKPKIVMANDKKHLNFIDDIFPIIEARCLKCHRDDKQEGGLRLSTFANAMNGGSSGEILLASGDLDGSRLFQMVMQEIDPIMPPRGKPLEDEQLDIIQKWIESGLRERSNSKVKVAKVEKNDHPVFVAAKIGDGPPPMPEGKLAAFASESIRPSTARALAVSPTASLMALGGDRQILLYNLDTYKMLGVLPFTEGEIYTMTFSLNGEMLFAGGGKEGDSAAAVLYDVRTGERVGTYGRGYDTILAGDISPDHSMLAIGGPDRKVRVYDTVTGDLFYELTAHTDWLYAIKFSPDGELLSSADRAGGVFFWQAANGREVEAMKGHNKAVNDMDYTYDSNLMATAGDEGEIIIWDTWKYKQVRKIKAHSGRVLSLDYRQDGQLVSSGEDGLTKRWDSAGKEVKAYEKMSDWAYQARFAKNGSLVLSTDWKGNIIAWDTEKGEKTATLSTKPAPEPAPEPAPKSAPALVAAETAD